MRVEPQPAGRLERQPHLLVGPGLPRLRVAAHLRGREAVEQLVIGGMHRDELALQVRRQLGDRDARLARRARELVAIVLALRCRFEVDQPTVPGRHLHADIAAVGRPAGEPSQESNGAASPANCARKIPGPLIVLIDRLPPVADRSRRRATTAQAPLALGMRRQAGARAPRRRGRRRRRRAPRPRRR